MLSAVFQYGGRLIGHLHNILIPLQAFLCLTCVILSLPVCCDSRSWWVKLSVYFVVFRLSVSGKVAANESKINLTGLSKRSHSVKGFFNRIVEF